MKKNFILMTTFVVALIVILFNVGSREVKAAGESCTTYTNYYLFMDSTSVEHYEQEISSGGDPWTRNPSKVFPSLPDGATIVDKGLVTIEDVNINAINRMSYQQYYNNYISAAKADYYPVDNGIIKYYVNNNWVEDSTASIDSSIPQTFEQFSLGLLNMNPSIQKIEKADDDGSGIKFTITRAVYSQNVAEVKAKGSDRVYIPGAYYIQYKICNPNVTITVNYGTNNDCTQGTDIKAADSFEMIVSDETYRQYPITKEIEKDGVKYEFSNIGTMSTYLSNRVRGGESYLSISGAPVKNSSICLVYIKSPQTGSNLLYIVLTIGILAFGYSMWYFFKYYKNRNSEV